MLFDAPELVEHPREPYPDAMTRGLLEQLHSRAHAEGRGRRQLGRHPRQVQRLRGHVDGRVWQAQQVLSEHIGQEDLHQVEQLLWRRSNALGPVAQQSLTRLHPELDLLAKQELVSSVALQRVAHRSRVVRDRS